MYLFEAINPLVGLPRHWIAFLTEKYGKNAYSNAELAGEKSSVEELKTTNMWEVKDALKDENILAVIGRIEAKPFFMIAKDPQKQIKYLLFETLPGKGRYDSQSSYIRYAKSDSFTLNEILDIIKKLKGDEDFSTMTLEKISRDPERKGKAEVRTTLRNIKDPYISSGTDYAKRPYTTPKQKEIIKKYAEKKFPNLNDKLSEEIEKLKKQAGHALEYTLASVIKDIKQGYSYSIDRKRIGESIASQLNTEGLQKLAKAYSVLITRYSSDIETPGDIAKKFKKLGY